MKVDTISSSVQGPASKAKKMNEGPSSDFSLVQNFSLSTTLMLACQQNLDSDGSKASEAQNKDFTTHSLPAIISETSDQGQLSLSPLPCWSGGLIEVQNQPTSYSQKIQPFF